MIEATEVKFFSRKMILSKLIGPAKLVPEILRRGNYSSTIKQLVTIVAPVSMFVHPFTLPMFILSLFS
jgi:hypothetical protein